MNPRQTPIKRARYFLEYLFFILPCGIIRLLPANAILFLGKTMGSLAFAVSLKRRRIAQTNIDIAFGNSKSRAEKKRIVKQSFIQLALSILQVIWVGIHTRERVEFLMEEKPEGLDTLKQCLDRGKGVFFLTAHYGNWEIMGINHGYLNVCTLYSIARELDNPRMGDFLMKMRTISGNKILYRHEPPLKIVRALKQNAGVAIMIDQNISKGGAFVNFFGKLAATTRAMPLLGYKTGTPIVPMFCYPTPKGKYKIVYGPELAIQRSGEKETDVLKITEACSRYLENVIRENPEHWMWIHRRWKTRPREQKKETIY